MSKIMNDAPHEDPQEATHLRVSGIDRRKEILDAATEVFGERGYVKGSLAEIGDRVGITRAGVLHHFGSKDELLIALLDYLGMTEASKRRLQPVADGGRLADQLSDVSRRGTESPGIIRGYTVLFAEAVTEGNPTTPFFRQQLLQRRSQIADAVKDEVKDLTDAEADEAAVAILAFIDGMRMHWLLNGDKMNIPAVVKRTITAIMDELRK